MKINGTKTLLAALAVGGLVLGAQAVFAGTMTGVCSSCHTMHNSQNGAFMTQNGAAANEQLLLNSCTGCHSGDAGPLLSSNDAPIVIHTTQPNTLPQSGVGTNNYTAAGSFYWVDSLSMDATGHNVATDTLIAQDGTLGNTPPGGTILGAQLECGRGEANGCHVANGTHHINVGGDQSSGPGVSVWVDGSANEASYRFLSGGIQGAENGDWEYTVDTDDHNVYWADATWNGGDTDTINAFCAKCHGNFHAQGTSGAAGEGQDVGGSGGDGVSPWIRHPTDISLSAKGGEYANYDTYDWIAPVGAAGTTTSVQFTNVASGTDSVLCLSCHRAHGSPYADMLRWSYGVMNSGTASPANVTGSGQAGKFGCFACHSTKD